MRLVLTLAAIALLLACPTSRRPTQTCEHAGEQCTLPDGPLGVCSPTTTGHCEHEPCLECMPQH